jgi:hypothetical protein
MPARVYRGTTSLGGPILTIDNNGWVYEGTPVFPLTGKPIMKISGEHELRAFPSRAPAKLMAAPQ